MSHRLLEKIEVSVPGCPVAEFWRATGFGLIDKAVRGEGKKLTGVSHEIRKSLHGCRQGKVLGVMDYREENFFIGPVIGILDGNRQELIAPKLVEATYERAPWGLQEITIGEFGWVCDSNVPVFISTGTVIVAEIRVREYGSDRIT